MSVAKTFSIEIKYGMPISDYYLPMALPPVIIGILIYFFLILDYIFFLKTYFLGLAILCVLGSMISAMKLLTNKTRARGIFTRTFFKILIYTLFILFYFNHY